MSNQSLIYYDTLPIRYFLTKEGSLGVKDQCTHEGKVYSGLHYEGRVYRGSTSGEAGLHMRIRKAICDIYICNILSMARKRRLYLSKVSKGNGTTD